MEKALYYPVWIAPNRPKGGWSWGKPCDTPSEAAKAVKEQLLAGATMGCVVEFAGGKKTPMTTFVVPASARKIVGHWEELWEATE